MKMADILHGELKVCRSTFSASQPASEADRLGASCNLALAKRRRHLRRIAVIG